MLSVETRELTGSAARRAAADIVLERNLDKLYREMGPILRAAMADSSVVEVMLNPDGMLWVDRLGEGMTEVGKMDRASALQFLGTIASMLGTQINSMYPVVEGELPSDGSRVEGLIPPLVSGPSFSLRKKASAVFSLQEYLESGRLTKTQKELLEEGIKARKNILVVGGTGSGKTTFTNGLIQSMKDLTPEHRLVILEDTVELQCPMKNSVSMRTTQELSMRSLLKITMRTRPDRIIVGEVRDGSALDLLKAWNTGHPGGVSTVHANDALAGLYRLEQLIAEVSQNSMQQLIGEVIDYCVFLRRDPKMGPKVEQIIAVEGVSIDGYKVKNLA